ncbi:hypothetical protein LTR60_003299, partial [Cryomyces antarcticus]
LRRQHRDPAGCRQRRHGRHDGERQEPRLRAVAGRKAHLRPDEPQRRRRHRRRARGQRLRRRLRRHLPPRHGQGVRGDRAQARRRQGRYGAAAAGVGTAGRRQGRRTVCYHDCAAAPRGRRRGVAEVRAGGAEGRTPAGEAGSVGHQGWVREGAGGLGPAEGGCERCEGRDRLAV